MKPHKHAELIKAWADGAEIQDRYKFGYGDWTDWVDNDEPTWQFDHEYRIKPEPKPDFVFYGCAWLPNSTRSLIAIQELDQHNNNIKLTFDGETGELKSSEVLK